ncbi:hypothetical protein BDQ17DRAFT_1362261 [Cyathus striatus]|nr:hypothetical protein BDQ17DRAFT_1362261 [Cyathus striatus]
MDQLSPNHFSNFQFYLSSQTQSTKKYEASKEKEIDSNSINKETYDSVLSLWNKDDVSRGPLSDHPQATAAFHSACRRLIGKYKEHNDITSHLMITFAASAGIQALLKTQNGDDLSATFFQNSADPPNTTGTIKFKRAIEYTGHRFTYTSPSGKKRKCAVIDDGETSYGGKIFEVLLDDQRKKKKISEDDMEEIIKGIVQGPEEIPEDEFFEMMDQDVLDRIDDDEPSVDFSSSMAVHMRPFERVIEYTGYRFTYTSPTSGKKRKCAVIDGGETAYGGKFFEVLLDDQRKKKKISEDDMEEMIKGIIQGPEEIPEDELFEMMDGMGGMKERDAMRSVSVKVYEV